MIEMRSQFRGRGLSPRRPAFTLIELMVALALIIFIMTILSAAFAAAGKTFRDLKAQGDLAEKLRGVMTLLRRDLAAPHFDPTDQKLSEIEFWSRNGGPAYAGFFRIWQDAQPASGPAGTQFPNNSVIPTFVTSRTMLHFTVTLPALTPNDVFSTDVCATSPPSPNAWTAVNGGNGLADQLFNAPYTTLFNQDQRFQSPIPTTAPAPPTAVLKSPYAEVAWWLTPTLSTTTQTASDDVVNQPPQQLWTLRRRIRLLWPENNLDSTNLIPAIPSVPFNPGNGLDEVSLPEQTGQNWPVNRMQDITMPPLRMGMQLKWPYNPVPPGYPNPITTGDSTYAGVLSQVDSLGNATYRPHTHNGAPPPAGLPLDIVLDGVVSFDVRVLLWDWTNNRPATEFVDLSDPSVTFFSTYINNLGVLQDRNPQFPTGLVPGTPKGPWVFDTWSQQSNGRYNYSYDSTNQVVNWQNLGSCATIPCYTRRDLSVTPNTESQPIRILAIQVTLRVYDFKTQTTRQVTMVQDM